MKERSAELIVENGGGNHHEIFAIIEDLFAFGQPPRPQRWVDDDDFNCQMNKYHTKSNLRLEVWTRLQKINCDRYYMEDGAKVTRPLKGLLLETFGKASVNIVFAAFCKRVGDIYVQVNATTHLHNTYFDRERSAEYGDENSCFFGGGCNRQNGKLIDASSPLGVITIHPEKTYAKGRMIVWFKDPTTAHLMNLYCADGLRELPNSIFARALEALSGTEIVWHRDHVGHLPIYLNNKPMVCRTTGEKTFADIIKNFKLKCTHCGDEYKPNQDHPTVMCRECTDNEESDHETCTNCGEVINDGDAYHNEHDEAFCDECYHDIYFYCEECENDHRRGDAVEVWWNRSCSLVCDSCASNSYTECSHCARLQHNDEIIEDTNANAYCPRCADDHTAMCIDCDERFTTDELDAEDRCDACAKTHAEEEEELEEKAS